MKSIAMKFVALVLAALCLLTAVAGGFAIALVSVWESEGWDVDQALKEEFRYLARDHAYAGPLLGNPVPKHSAPGGGERFGAALHACGCL